MKEAGTKKIMIDCGSCESKVIIELVEGVAYAELEELGWRYYCPVCSSAEPHKEVPDD